MRAVKKITAFLLAMVMVLSLVTTVVYAASQIDDVFSVTFDNTAPNPGETITAVMSLDRSTADVYKLWSSIYYNKDVLSCEKVEFYGTEIAYEITEDTAGEYDSEVRFDENGRSDDSVAQKIQALPQGPFAKITFKVSSTCDIGQAINYRVKGGVYAKTGRLPTTKWENDFTMAVGTDSNPRTETGYTVSMGADQQVAADQKVRIPVTVTSSEKNITGFNAYDMIFTYDPAALTLNTKTDDAANLTVKDDNGTVRVRRYGATQALGEALALDFTAIKAASSAVTLTSAKFDIDANSINFDAPDAAISDADTVVKGLWKVTLPDGFLSTAANGSTLVENGGDFTFKTTDTHYEYYLNITTNGATNIVKMDNATYTIKNVTDNVTVTVDNKIGKTYTINYVVVDNTTTENKATVADLVAYSTTTVQYPNDYKFTVKFPGTGYVVWVGIEPNKNKRDYVRQENGDYVYTLLGSSLTGDENNEITITLTKRENTSQHKIEVVGSGSDAFSENNALTFYSGENYTFTLNKNDTYYDYSVLVYYWQQNIGGNGGKNIRMEYKDNGDGIYTIIDMPYADVTISINKMAKAIDPDAVEVSTYVELDNKTVFKVVVQGSHELLNRDQTTYSYTWFTYDGQKMYCNPRYTKFAGNGSSSSVYLVMVDKGETLTKEDAMAKLGIVTSTEQENKDQTLKVGSDVNEDGIGGVGINRRDVNDVQLIYDLYNGLYDSFETVSMRKFLKADVNYDGVLDSQDAVKLAGELLAD